MSICIGATALAGVGGYLHYTGAFLPSISLWGHSFFGNNQTFSSKLIAETGCKVFNFGLSGATSESIALRNGAYHKSYASVNGLLTPAEKTT